MARARKWTIWILIIVAIIGSIFLYVKSRGPKTTYTTADVARGTLAQTVSITGNINPNEQIDLDCVLWGLRIRSCIYKRLPSCFQIHL